MLFPSRETRFMMTVFVLAFPLAIAHAQAVSVSTSRRPAGLAGLYRLETPANDSSSVITFLRLLPNGRSRIESLHIDASGTALRARVQVGPFSTHPWRTKLVTTGGSPQLCFEIRRAESCAAFHKQGPRGDLLLFAPEALWGEPTLVLRRQAGQEP